MQECLQNFKLPRRMSVFPYLLLLLKVGYSLLGRTYGNPSDHRETLLVNIYSSIDNKCSVNWIDELGNLRNYLNLGFFRWRQCSFKRSSLCSPSFKSLYYYLVIRRSSSVEVYLGRWLCFCW